MRLFITGIGTDVGKTVTAAIITKALEGHYWKPVQTGADRDTDRVRALTNDECTYHPEAYHFSAPLSPDASSALESTEIDLGIIRSKMPSVSPLIIEGAGGVLVPLNKRSLMVDLAKELDTLAVVVSRTYLGSINHTLLTLEALASREIPILGIVFNGARNVASEESILRFAEIEVLGHIAEEPGFTPEMVKGYANAIRPELLTQLQIKEAP
jgi:dethiobiotin synthetase